MKYSKSYQSGHNEPVLLASSEAKPNITKPNITKPNITKPNITKPKKQKNTPYGNKKEEFRRENATAMPWLTSAKQSITSACGSANNYCNNGNMQACQWRDKECSGVGYATIATGNSAPPLPPWLSSGGQSITSACGSANNYCNNGNMQACQWRDKECSGVGPLCAVEKSEIKNLKTELSEVQRAYYDLDAAKASHATEAEMEVNISSTELVGLGSEIIEQPRGHRQAFNKLFGDPGLFLNGNIRDMPDLVDHVWKSIGWDFDLDGNATINEIADAGNTNNNASMVFGVKFSNLLLVKGKLPDFTMTNSNIRHFRRKFAKRLYYTYYSFVIRELGVVFQSCRDLHLVRLGLVESERQDSEFVNQVNNFCGIGIQYEDETDAMLGPEPRRLTPSAYIQKEYTYHFANLHVLSRNITKWGGVPPPVEFQQHITSLVADYRESMERLQRNRHVVGEGAVGAADTAGYEGGPIHSLGAADTAGYEGGPIHSLGAVGAAGYEGGPIHSLGAVGAADTGVAHQLVREDIVMPPDTDVETFTVKAKEVILTIVKDEKMPGWVYETIPAEIREEIKSEHGLSLNTAKWSEIFRAMEPTNPEGLLSRGDPRDVSFIIWQRRQIIIIVSYALRHLKNNEEWIISTMAELMSGHYKSNEYVSLAVEFFTILGRSVGLNRLLGGPNDANIKQYVDSLRNLKTSSDAVIYDLRRTVDRMQEELAESEEEESMLAQQIQYYLETIHGLEITVTDLREKIEILESKKTSLNESLNSHGKTITELDATIKSLKEQLEPLRSGNANLTSDLENKAVKAAAEAAVTATTECAAARDELIKNHEEAQKANEENVTELNESISGLDTTIASLGEQIETLRSDKTTLTGKISDLEASLSSLSVGATGRVAEIVDKAVEEITTLDSVTKKLTTQKKELETKLKKAEEDLAMRNKIIIGLAVFIFILIIVLLIK